MARKTRVALFVLVLLGAMLLATAAYAWEPACNAKGYLTYTNACLNNYSWGENQVSKMTLKQTKSNVAASPGGIFYWVEFCVCDKACISIDDLVVTKKMGDTWMPTDNFGYVSKNPIHIYVDGTQVYVGNTLPQEFYVDASPDNHVTVVVSVHYKYQDSIAEPGTYRFMAKIKDEWVEDSSVMLNVVER